LKQTINLGAYGWRHRQWLKSFYPEDLPVEADADWRLAYYSNEFNTVLVPADYWQAGQINNCEDWLHSVQSDFQFFVECHHSMFDSISLSELTSALKRLTPQLSALVVLDEEQSMPDVIKKQFIEQVVELADSLELEVFGGVQKIWRPDRLSNDMQPSRFAFIEDDLTDLRSVRATVEQFAAQINDNEMGESEAIIIVNHAQLQAGNLSKFRAVLDIMGY